MDTENYCLECKKRTEIILDNRSGDTICTVCGLVLESWHIEETMEWRTFTDDSSNNRDPNRVGNPHNPFLSDSNLTTLISKPNKSSSDATPHHKKLNDPDSIIIKRFNLIHDMASQLGIVLSVEHRAADIFKSIEQQKSCKGRKLEAIVAACLFIACRESKVSRTLKEFTTLPYELKEKDIYKAVDLIRQQVEVETGAVGAIEFVARFCSHLGLERRVVKAVREVVERADKLDLRRSPKSLLGAIIYMVSQVCGDGNKRSVGDVSLAVEVAQSTIKKCYKDIYPYASTLIPRWFASDGDIKRLECP